MGRNGLRTWFTCCFILVCGGLLHGQEAALSLGKRAKHLFQHGQYQEADSLFRQALAISDPESLERAEVLYHWAEQKISFYEFAEVDEMLRVCVDIRAKRAGKKSIAYALAVNKQGDYYLYSGKIPEAFKCFEEAERVSRKAVGITHPLYALIAQSMGQYYLLTGDLHQAQQYYDRALAIYREHVDDRDYYKIMCLFSSSTLFGSRGMYETAIEIITETLPVFEETYGRNNVSYAAALSNLGGIYHGIAQYDKAEEFLLPSLHIFVSIVGKKHPYYFNALNTLGLIYNSKGLYRKAEEAFRESLALREEVYGKAHYSVYNARNNLAAFQMDIGNYKEAQRLILETMYISEQANDTLSLDYALRLMNLSQTYSGGKNPIRMLELLERSRAIQEQLNIPNQNVYLSTLEQIVDVKKLFPDQNKQDVETQMLDIIEQRKKQQGENSKEYLTSINNLVLFYLFNGEAEKAEEWWNASFNVMQHSVQLRNLYLNVLINGADVKLRLNKKEEAYALCRQAFGLLQEEIRNSFVLFSEEEQENFWKSKNVSVGYFLSLVDEIKEHDRTAPGFAYNCVLFSKSLLLNSSGSIHQAIVNSEDSLLIDWWNAFLEYKKLAIEMQSIKNEWMLEIARDHPLSTEQEIQEAIMQSEDKEAIDLWNSFAEIKNEVHRQEKEIIAASAAYKEAQDELNVEWQDIQQALQPDEVCIEFIHFEHSFVDNWKASTSDRYAALVLDKNADYPIMLTLCSTEELKQAIDDSPYDFHAVYPLVWQPLEKYLEGKKRIFLSPTGLLHNVSFAGMKNANKTRLTTLHKIHYLLSTKDVMAYREKSETKASKEKTAAFFGGADFSLSDQEIQEGNADLRNRGQGFDFLPGSKQEVIRIANYLSGLDWDCSVFTDKKATEERFKSLSSIHSPQLIHLSTHGFYLSNPNIDRASDVLSREKNSKYHLSEHSLMRSGLILSGGNKAWLGDDSDEKEDDGILTALEVSNLNLTNTELVVLSACETGLGDVDTNEGIYGLQRAFRLAGVKQLLVSLWKVPDKETLELMLEFYQEWSRDIPVKEALDKAQTTLQARYPDSPEKWGGFILIE